MLSWSKKLMVVFSLLIAADTLYTLSSLFSGTSSNSTKLLQELSTKERISFQWRRNRIQLVQKEDTQLIILILSAPIQNSKRIAIRQTWLSLLVNNSFALGRSNIRRMNNPSNLSSTMVIHYWFVCGRDTKEEVETAVENEIAVYGDILRLDYKETYSQLVFKTLSSFWLASTMNVHFIVKVDDDVYLHVPKMIWWLKTSSLPEKLYAGAVQDGIKLKVIRDPRHKWFVSEQLFNNTWFPSYCNGPFYILSKSALLELLKASSSEGLTPFPLEDAYTGILANRAGIRPLQLNGKHVLIKGPNVARGLGDARLNQFFALGHGVSIARMVEFHKRFTNLTLT